MGSRGQSGRSSLFSALGRDLGHCVSHCDSLGNLSGYPGCLCYLVVQLVILASILGNMALGGLALLSFIVGFTNGPMVLLRICLILSWPVALALIADQWGLIYLRRLVGLESSMDDASQASGARLLLESSAEAPPVDIL